MHRRFEEFCAQAVTGYLDPASAEQLREHARCCQECREFLADAGTLQKYLDPTLLSDHIEEATPPEGMRERFLRRAAEQGYRLTAGPALEPASSKENRATQKSHRGRLRDGLWAWRPQLLAASAACLCVMLGYAGARWSMRTAAAPRVAPTAAVVASAPVSAPVAVKTRGVDALRAQFDALQKKLVQQQQSNRQLETMVGALQAQNARSGEQQAALEQALAQQSQSAQRLAALASERDALRGMLAAAQLELKAEKGTTAEAKNQIERMQDELQHRQQKGLAQAQEMISSRNLHIIDIYENTSGSRGRQLAGRVFYVEGKSLVFYAYDLPEGHARNQNQTFRVWGESAGANGQSYQLGVMRREANGQNRWELSFSDARVLSRINAVYVSNDPPSLAPDNPHRMMYAFLGSANHP